MDRVLYLGNIALLRREFSIQFGVSILQRADSVMHLRERLASEKKIKRAQFVLQRFVAAGFAGLAILAILLLVPGFVSSLSRSEGEEIAEEVLQSWRG